MLFSGGAVYITEYLFEQIRELPLLLPSFYIALFHFSAKSCDRLLADLSESGLPHRMLDSLSTMLRGHILFTPDSPVVIEIAKKVCVNECFECPVLVY